MKPAEQKDMLQILEQIETGRYKSAVSLATKGLKKHSESVLIKAMLAYASERTGNTSFALELCDQLMQLRRPPVVDDLALQLISSVLRSTGKGNLLVSLYANAAAHLPHSVEYATNHHMSLVRVSSLKEMQQVALKMHKSFRDERFFFWGVSAIYLQGIEAPPGSPNIYFPLAEKMLEKAKEENRITTFEELHLYILILSSQRKYLACVKLLSSPLAERLCKVESELQHLVLEFMHLAGQTDSVVDLSRDALSNGPDDWRTHLSMVESLHALVLEEYEDLSAVEDIPSLPDFKRAMDFLHNLQTEAKGTVKGPWLGEMELLAKFGLVADLEPLLLAYFHRFGTTISFFEDVSKYLDLIPSASRNTLVASVLSVDPNVPGTDAAKIAALRKRINAYKMQVCLGAEEVDVDAFVGKMMAEYQEGLELGKELTAKERQYGDDCLVLAVLMLMQQFDQDRENTSLLYRSLFLLESGLQKSTYNFQLKIMLMRMYAWLGVSQPVVTHSLSLEVKQVLLDTLTYLYADDFERYAPLDTAGVLVKKALSIYRSNEKETPEMVIQAYKFGTYSKIPEFRRFQLKLSQSIQQTISTRQVALVQLLTLSRRCDVEPLVEYVRSLETEKFSTTDAEIDQLHDNRDRSMDVKWKSGKSFFEVLAGPVDAIPAPRKSWIQIYGAIPVVLKSWIDAGVGVDASALEVVANVSAEENLAANVVAQMTAYFENQDETILDSVISQLATRQGEVQASVSKMDSFSSSNKIHELFEAISFSRIATSLLSLRQTAISTDHESALQAVADAFRAHLMGLMQGLEGAAAVKELKATNGVVAVEEMDGAFIRSGVVENVMMSVRDSYKGFLESMVSRLE
ncbi:N-alpha-acetyltransferase 25, NatB auxiliary subunit [Podochytrium sp. JEL0797]|nr:N-alpha-acetyltransferase 25, NatB auxiliary subunit [Podochytrium sp. JEL0797]